jgi:hypothetical protein
MFLDSRALDILFIMNSYFNDAESCQDERREMMVFSKDQSLLNTTQDALLKSELQLSELFAPLPVGLRFYSQGDLAAGVKELQTLLTKLYVPPTSSTKPTSSPTSVTSNPVMNGNGTYGGTAVETQQATENVSDPF